MLRDRVPAVDHFALVPDLALQFAPVRARLDDRLDDDAIFHAVKADRARRFPQTLRTGRASTPVEVVLRRLIVRRLYGWSYAETEHFVGDSLMLRQFCRIGIARVPDHTTAPAPDDCSGRRAAVASASPVCRTIRACSGGPTVSGRRRGSVSSIMSWSWHGSCR